MRRRLTDESGQSLVEFALILPILLLLVLGIVDLARAYHLWNEQTNTAERGARYAAVGSWPGSPGVTLATYLCNNLATSEPDLVNQHPKITIGAPNPQVPSTKAGDPVKVEIQSNYPLIPFVKNELRHALTPSLDSTATMRLEIAPPSGMFTTTPQQC